MCFLPIMCARHGERREGHDSGAQEATIGGGGEVRKNDNNYIEWTTDRRRCNALMLIRSTSYSAAL